MKAYMTFREFWPFYLSQHFDARNRLLHYLGTTSVIACLIAVFAFGQGKWFPLVFLVGYGPAWIGHFIIEKNRPATFTYPFYSLAGDFRMYFLALSGRLGPELRKAHSSFH